MSDWERDANKALQALGEAWQQGGISRETYRARRRRLIAALRERRDETERRAVGSPAPADAPPPHGEAGPMAVPGGGMRRGSVFHARGATIVAVSVAIALALAAWMVWSMEQGNV